MGAEFGRILRQTCAAFLLGAAALIAFAAPDTAAARGPGGFIVVDSRTGAILEQKNASTRMHPASLTKMMTLYLAFDAIETKRLDPGQMLRVSRHAQSMPPSELGLSKGDRISLRDAIRGAAIKSANDAAVVIAEAVGGDEERFAELMTAKARELGMKDTTFKNASGLTQNGHLSTPRDMVILARRLYLDFNDYYWMFSKRSMRIRGQRYNATNSLLGVEAGVDGVKTGYTRMAGFNLAASAERDGERVFVVRMGAGTRSRRDRDVARLLDRGFERVATLRRIEEERDRRNSSRELVAALEAAPPPTPRPSAIDTATVAAAGTADAVAAAPGDATGTATGPATEESIRVGATARLIAEETALALGLTGWRIQVGAFRSAKSANRLLDALATRYPDRLGKAGHAIEAVTKPGETDPSLYRARFGGLSQETAEAACRALKAAGDGCALVPPSGWTQIASR